MSGVLNLLLAGAASAIKDAYFNLTTLLLNTSSTNGAQNNTFLDSSTNNFTITRNGNTTQGTFTPFSQTGWSNYLDGSGDGFSYSGTTFGSGAWTVELWFYFTGASFTGPIQLFEGTTNSLVLAIMSATSIRIDQVNVSNDAYTVPTMSANTWYHLTATKDSSGNQTIFLNGTRSSTGVTTTSRNFSSATLRIGYSAIGGTDFTGYFSNLRFVTGTAVYNPLSSTITVPTAPLTAISGTSLLTCQSNRFLDTSTNAFALTVNGTPSVQAFSPFLPTAAYDTAVVGGSGYFDGSGDYLSIADNAAFSQTADFSEDCWVYFTGSTANGNYQYFGSASGNPYFQIGVTGSGYFVFGKGFFPDVISSNGQAGVAKQGQWYHVAITRQSNTCRLFVNGVLQGTATDSASTTSSGPFYIGQLSTVYPFLGYMNGFRFVKGGVPSLFSTSSTTAGATIFTPPTAPYTGSESLTAGSVSLLLNYTNAGIYDSASKNVLETVGNAQVSTTQAKWGTTAMYFDGTGDVVYAPATTINDLSSGDWTIEGWVNVASFAATGHFVFWNGNTTAYAGIRLGIDTNQQLFFLMSQNGSSWAVNTGAIGNTLSTSTWYHLAITRSGTSVKVFVNGTQVGTTYTVTGSLYAGTLNYVGAINSSGVSQSLNGYIDDFRVTKGYARYTANFTAPTAAFPLQ